MYELVKWLHVLLFGVWLGADYGTFLSSRMLADPQRPVAVRTAAARMMVLFDVGPRVALVLILPAGLTLAQQSGLVSFTDGWLAPLWLAGAAWLAMVLAVELNEEASWREPLRRTDLVIRLVLAPVLLVLAAWSLIGDGPFKVDWVAWKLLLFALILAAGIGIRFGLQRFSPVFGSIITDGSTPEREQALQASLKPLYPLVGGIWIAVLIAGYLGVAKP